MLTGQKRKFAQALMSGSSQAEAARKAGYSEKTARSQGSRLAKDPDIIAFISKNVGPKSLPIRLFLNQMICQKLLTER